MSRGAPFWERLRTVAAMYPQRPALASGPCTVSYSDLLLRAGRVGAALRARGVEPGEVVGLYLEKGIDYIVALLGCWAAGAAFLPLDPSLPEPRLRFLITDAEIRWVLAQPQDHGCLPGLHWISPDGTEYGNGESGSDLVGSAPLISGGPESEEDWSQVPAYLIYTSGSTGTPKGVLVGHGGVLNLVTSQIAAFDLEATSRTLLYLSVSFDASISDIGTTLLAGACLCIEPAVESLSPRVLVQRLKELGITHLDLPPALLRVVDPEQLPECLRGLIIGGEACVPEVVRRHAARRRVINVYGPTEATVCVSLGDCDAVTWQRPLLGRPIAGMRFHIVDVDGLDVAPGTPGELWLSGPGLALRYLNRPDLTAQRFVYRSGVRLYRTGDRVVEHETGEFEFLGRVDRQLKLRGRLIEPAEVEAVLSRQPGVAREAVLRREDVPGRAVLVAFVELDGSTDPACTAAELSARLGAELPRWMVPQRIVVLERLPLTAAGKVDLARLATLPLPSDGESGAGEAQTESGAVALEEVLCDLFGRVLGRAVGAEEDFFLCGGDSLSALVVVAGAEVLGLPLTVDLLWRQRTARAVAAHLAEDAGEQRTAAELRADVDALITQDAGERAGRGSVRWTADHAPSGVTEDGALLLTGATGQLGARLLQILLRDTESEVYCVVRAPDEGSARARLHAVLAARGIHLTEAERSRLRALPGDIEQERLGLSDALWHTLSIAVSEVHHVAALVNLVRPYEALRPANLLAVREVLRLCRTGRRKRLHHTSTLSVFVESDRAAGRHEATDDLGQTGWVQGGYAQSKWAAEYLLRQSCHAPLWCHRLGLLTGTAPGAVSEPLVRFLRGVTALGCVPEGLREGVRMDLTPLDWAAEGMGRLRRAAPGTYHLASPHRGATLGELLRALDGAGVRLPRVCAAAWRERLRGLASPDEAAAYLALSAARTRHEPGAAARRQRPWELFLSTDSDFTVEPTLQALAATGGALPSPDSVAALLRAAVREAITPA